MRGLRRNDRPEREHPVRSPLGAACGFISRTSSIVRLGRGGDLMTQNHTDSAAPSTVACKTYAPLPSSCHIRFANPAFVLITLNISKVIKTTNATLGPAGRRGLPESVVATITLYDDL